MEWLDKRLCDFIPSNVFISKHPEKDSIGSMDGDLSEVAIISIFITVRGLPIESCQRLNDILSRMFRSESNCP